MNRHSLKGFGAYRKARELSDPVVVDAEKLPGDRKPEWLVSQQIASADLVCTNMGEGYRLGYRRCLILSRGSLRETRGIRAGCDIGCAEVVSRCIALADEIG